MLQTIRSKTSGVFAWIFIIVIGFVFALWGIQGYIGGGSDQVAKVNGEVITLEDYQRTYERLLRQQQMMQALQGQGDVVNEALLRQQALGALVSEKMLLTDAHKTGFAVGRTQVDELLLLLPQFQVDGEFSPELFQSVLSGMLYTPAGFRDAVQDDLMIGQVRSSIVDSAFVLPYEIEQTVELLEQKRDVQYLLIPAIDYLPEVSIDDEALREYYDAHQNEFMLPEQIDIAYIRLNADDLDVALEADEQTLQTYYDVNQARYSTPERRRAAHILLMPDEEHDLAAQQARAEDLITQLNAGADFAALAEEYSADPGSAAQGGDLGWFGRGEMVAPFEAAAFDASADEIVGPVETDFGVHIIQVTEIEPQVVESFDAVRDEILANWQQEQREAEFVTAIMELDTLAFEDSDTLDTAAQALDLPIQTTGFFSRDNTASLGELDQPGIVDAAFSDDVLFEERNSEIVYLDSTDVLVLRQADYEAPHVQEFAAVSDRIYEMLALDQATAKAHDAADAWLAAIQSGTAVDALDVGILTWENADETGRYNFEVPPEVLDTAFSLTLPEAEGIAADTTTVGMSDFAIVVVNDVYAGALEAEYADEMRAEYEEGLLNLKGELDYQLYVADVQERSNISVDAQF